MTPRRLLDPGRPEKWPMSLNSLNPVSLAAFLAYLMRWLWGSSKTAHAEELNHGGLQGTMRFQKEFDNHSPQPGHQLVFLIPSPTSIRTYLPSSARPPSSCRAPTAISLAWNPSGAFSLTILPPSTFASQTPSSWAGEGSYTLRT